MEKATKLDIGASIAGDGRAGSYLICQTLSDTCCDNPECIPSVYVIIIGCFFIKGSGSHNHRHNHYIVASKVAITIFPSDAWIISLSAGRMDGISLVTHKAYNGVVALYS